jgi:hypothetical protein
MSRTSFHVKKIKMVHGPIHTREEYGPDTLEEATIMTTMDETYRYLSPVAEEREP